MRAIKVSSPAAQERFISTFSEYVYAVIDEASDRAKGHIRSVEDYLKLTRLTAGGYPSFVAVEAGLNIPNEVMAHPTLQTISALAAESLVLTNVRTFLGGYDPIVLTSDCQDMYSYNIEQASGHGGHNIVTVVMNEKGVGLDGALNWLGEYHGQVLSNFQAQRRMLPSWGPAIDSDVGAFVERLGYWIRGIDSWSLETERYFGAKGPEIQKHRLVTLLPKVKKPDVTPMMAQLSA